MIKSKISFVTVIDIGSNSIKMTMARMNHKVKVVLEDKLPLRLLEKDETSISRKKINLLNRSLARFFQRTRKYSSSYKVFATSAMRRAKNRKEVIAMLKKKWGIRVKIISGDREAKYVLSAVKSKFNLSRGKFCIADIGGGSMELIQLDNGKTKWMKSIPYGSVVVKEKFCLNPIIDDLDIGMIVGNIMEGILHSIPGKMEGVLILSGGTPSTIARIFQTQKKWQDVHGKVILMKDLRTLFKPLIEKPILFWTLRHRINSNRRDLILPCMSTVIALMRIMNQDYFQLSRTGLRQGVVFEAFHSKKR